MSFLPSVRAMSAAFLLLGETLAWAQPKTEVLACGQGIHVASNGAGLRELLHDMAAALRFDLQYWSSENPLVRVEARLTPRELVRLLSREANLVVRYRSNPRCRGELQIASVWVLSPGGAGSTPVRAVGTPVPAAVLAAPSPSPSPAPAGPATPDAVGAEEPGIELYRRGHGVLPQRP